MFLFKLYTVVVAVGKCSARLNNADYTGALIEIYNDVLSIFRCAQCFQPFPEGIFYEV